MKSMKFASEFCNMDQIEPKSLEKHVKKIKIVIT